jgi:hypothetical protein
MTNIHNTSAAQADLASIVANDAKGEALRGCLALHLIPELDTFHEATWKEGDEQCYIAYTLRTWREPVHKPDGTANGKAARAKKASLLAHYGYDADRDALAASRAYSALDKAIGAALMLDVDPDGIFYANTATGERGKLLVKTASDGTLTGIPADLFMPMQNDDGTLTVKAVDVLSDREVAKRSNGQRWNEAKETAKLLGERVGCTGKVHHEFGQLPTNSKFAAMMTKRAVEHGLLPIKAKRQSSTASAGNSFTDSLAFVDKTLRDIVQGDESDVALTDTHIAQLIELDALIQSALSAEAPAE